MIARGPPTNSWVAGLARQAPIPHLRPSPHLRRLLRSRLFRRPRLHPHPLRAHDRSPPRKRPVRDGGISRCSDAGKSADSTVMYNAQQLPVPAARKPPVTRLDEPVVRQVVHDSWAAADLDETSTGMPRSMFQLTRFLPPTRAPRTMRAVRHIPIIPIAILAPVASRPRIMALHRAIISTIRTLPRLHRNMTRRPRPRRRIPRARAKSALPIITPRKRRCVSRNFRRQSRLPLSPLSLPCSASLRLRDSSCSAAPPRPNRQRSKRERQSAPGHQHPQGRPQRRGRVAGVKAATGFRIQHRLLSAVLSSSYTFPDNLPIEFDTFP